MGAENKRRRVATRSRWSFVLVSLLLSAPVVLTAQTTSRSSAPSPADAEKFQRATQALQANKPGDAVSLFQQVTHDSPRFAEAYLNLGLALTQLSRNEEAVQALEKGIGLKPAMRGAHLFLAISQYRLGHLEPASAAIRKEVALNHMDAQAWMWQGIIDLALLRLAEAVEDLDRAYTIDPKNVDILYHRGRAALALSRQSYEAMFKLDPGSWHVHQVLAEADVESGNDADAVEQYKQAIAVALPQVGLYEGLGSAFWRVGKYDEAAQAYEQALALDSNDTITLYKLGCLRVDRSDAARGKPLLERVLVADPGLTMTRYYLGRAELQLGNDRAAIEDFDRTIRENLDADTTKQAYFQLSRAYRKLHDVAASEQAQAQYRLLDQRSKDAMQEKLSRRLARDGRDASIPASSSEAAPTTP